MIKSFIFFILFSDDKKLLERIVKTHKDNACLKVGKSVIDTFSVVHTAKTVEYNIFGNSNFWRI